MMKKLLLFSVSVTIGLLLSLSSWGQTVIDFETAGNGYTPSTTFGSSQADVFNRVNPNIGGNSSYFWAAEDISGGETLTIDQIDITSKTSFTFSIDLLTPNSNDWDSTDEMLITYSVDGGGYQNLLWVQADDDDAYNEPAQLDLDFDGEGNDGEELPAISDDHSAGVGSNFQTFTTSSISLSGNSTLDILITFNSLTSNDEGIYLDNITITTVGGTPTPTISLSASELSGFNYTVGSGPSTEQTFTVEGTNLTDDITLTPPTNYEISESSGSGFGSSITLTESGGSVSTTTIYVRLKSGLTAGTYDDEDITASSSGATNQTVECDGAVSAATPTITLSESNLTGFTYVEGAGPSTEQTFTVEGTNLTAGITLTPTTDYEISESSGSGYGSSITLTQSGGSVSTTTIYVRLKSGLSTGTYNDENITASSTGATSQTVECDGNVTSASACATDLIISEYIEGSSNNKYIEIYNGTGSSVNLADYDLVQYNNGSSSISYTLALSGSLSYGSVYVIGNSSGTIYSPDLSTSSNVMGFNGDDAIALRHSGTNIDIIGQIGTDPGSEWGSGLTSTQDNSLIRKSSIVSGDNNGSDTFDPATEWDGYAQDAESLGSHTMSCGPTITVSPSSLTDLNYALGNGPSAEQTFTISGSNLTDNISISAPANYEISETSSSGFGTSITLTQSGGDVSATTIYVRLKSGLSAGDYNSEDITASSTDATDKTVTCNGTVTGPTISVSETSITGFEYYYGNGPSSSQTFTVEGSSLSDDLVITAPTNYEVSDDDATFSSSVSLTPVSNEVATTTIYVRLKSGLSIGAYNLENITISTTGASNDTVSCSGNVILAPVSGLDVGCTTNNSADISWTAPVGTYDGVIIAVRNSTNVPHTISDGTDPSTLNASTVFTSGTEFGSTTPYSYIVFKGTGTSVTVTGLTAGQDYRIKAYTYSGTNWIDDSDCPTTSITSLSVPEVTSVNKVNGNTEGEISWNPPNVSCYDEVMIICTEGSSVTASPSGNGSTYTANSIFGSGTEITTGEYVVFKGTGNSITITGLTNDLTYYATIFVRKGTEWSVGTEVILNPDDVTFLEYGDLAVVAVNTNGTTGDEFSFVAFVDISEGTTIDFTDNGYERLSSGLWADSEGFLSFTRQNSSIAAGKVMTFETIGNVGTPTLGTNVNVYLDGVLDNANWTATSSGSGSGFNFNSDDQIWVMQGGTWSDPAGTHNATYSGTVLYGWTAIGWESFAGYDDTAGSTIFPGCECATTNVAGLTNNSKVKYDGAVTSTTKTGWIGRINNPSNWDDYADNTTYDAGIPLYKQDGATFSIEAGDLTEGKWAGYKSSEWCDCANWWSLKVPDASIDVEIPVVTSPNYKLVLEDNTDCVAECNTIEILDTVTNNTGAILIVNGDFTLNTGTLQFNTNTIDLQIGGDIVIDDASKFLTSKADLTMNGSGSQSFDVEGAILETVELNSLNISSGGTKTIADNLDIATDLTADNSIFNSSTSGSSLTIDGNITLQNGATMHDNCKSNLDIILSTSVSQVLRSSGNSIKALSITADKANADLSLSTTGGTTTLDIGALGDFNFTGTGTFTDNAGTIQTDDDLYLGGDGTSNYNLTGTALFTGANTIGDIVLSDNDGSSAIAAELYNLTIQGGELEIYPTAGSQAIVINNNFTIQNAAITDANGNDLEIGGNYSVNSDASIDASGITITLNGTNDQNISANSDLETFGTLIINKASGNINLSDNIEANELSLISGLINTSTNRVYVSNTTAGNLSDYSTASYINGNLRRAVLSSGNYDFPVGNATNYELANLNLNSSSGLNYIDASFHPIDAGDLDISELGLSHGGVAVETILDAGFWTIEPNSGISGISYNIGLSERGASNAGTAPEQHTVIKRTNSSSDWTLPGHHDNSTQSIAGGVVYAYRDNIGSMSDFAIAKNNTNVLPVELLSFSIKCNDSENKLIWFTASEVNNDYFEIQRSYDAKNWISIDKVQGAGNSNDLLRYEYTDIQPKGKTYYRLKQVDYDGKYAYSEILVSNCSNMSEPDIDIYPNPVLDIAKIKIKNWNTDQLVVEIYDMLGKQIYHSKINLFNGFTEESLNLSKYNSGIYLIRISDGKTIENFRIEKQ